MAVNGGIVTSFIRYPAHLRNGLVFAVQGVWSGGTWSPGDNLTVQQFRNYNPLGVWKMVGVNLLARQNADAVLLLEAIGESHEFLQGDILIFGDGHVTVLNLASLDVAVQVPIAVKVGPQKFHSVALPDNKILVFHQNDATLPNQLNQNVWIGNDVHTCILQRRLDDDDGYFIEFYLNHAPVTLKRLLNTLNPVRAFTLDAGQELMFMAPTVSGNNRLKATYTTFEPIVTVEPGSVRVLIHAADPAQMPLFVKPDEPLRIMADVLRAASEGEAELAASLLVSKFFSSDVFINRLRQIAEVAVKNGDLTIRTSDGNSDIVVGERVARTLTTSMDIIPLRTEERNGIILGIDLSRNWLRLRWEGEDKNEEWMLTFPREMREQLHGHMPRNAYVLFETRTLPEMTRGRGKLIDVRNLE